jgi:hypothetical protein
MALNEKQQTEAVFKSMRTDVDPVSGNEVPPGSLPEEVRDDIPAMLSEGEYVVPADVLRFYGMKFFEDLRTQAKMGLADMEANGRIGGEPVEGPAMGADEELTPEEQAEIEAMVMAVGGYVPQGNGMQQQNQQPNNQQTMQIDPYAQQQNLYKTDDTNQPQVGFSEGGVPTDTQVDPSNYATRFAPGFTFLEGANAAEFSIATLYGPNGEVVTLTLPADQAKYDALLEEGYSPDPAAATSVSADTSVGENDSSPEDNYAVDEETLSNPSFDVYSIDSKDLASTAARLDTLHRGAKAFSALIPGIAGAAIMTGVSARFNDVIERMEEEGIKHDYERKSNIFGGESSLYGGLKDTDNSGTVGFGDTWLGDMLGFDGKFGVQGVSLTESRQGARRTTSTGNAGINTATDMSPAQVQAGQDNADRGDDRDTSWSGGSVASNKSKPDSKSSSSQARSAAKKAADKLGTKLATGGK